MRALNVLGRNLLEKMWHNVCPVWQLRDIEICMTKNVTKNSVDSDYFFSSFLPKMTSFGSFTWALSEAFCTLHNSPASTPLMSTLSNVFQLCFPQTIPKRYTTTRTATTSTHLNNRESIYWKCQITENRNMPQIELGMSANNKFNNFQALFRELTFYTTNFH